MTLPICGSFVLRLTDVFANAITPQSWEPFQFPTKDRTPSQLVPQEGIGSFFARRLFWSTVVSSVGALAAGVLVDDWPFGEKLHAYSIAFLAAGISGLISSAFLARVPEPRMHQVGAPSPVLSKFQAPFRNANFRSLIVFMRAWNAVSNLAAPFLTVYLLTQLGYPLSTVTTLWIASQLSNALTLHLGGRISDQVSNKAILAVALPAYFACLLGFVFIALPTKHEFTLPLLYVFHIVMGAAAGGIGLATGNIALNLSPAGQGTVYLASVSLAGSFAGGISPLLGGRACRLVLGPRTGAARALGFAGQDQRYARAAVRALGVPARGVCRAGTLRAASTLDDQGRRGDQRASRAPAFRHGSAPNARPAFLPSKACAWS